MTASRLPTGEAAVVLQVRLADAVEAGIPRVEVAKLYKVSAAEVDVAHAAWTAGGFDGWFRARGVDLHAAALATYPGDDGATKFCPGHKRPLPIEQFAIKRSASTGRQSQCRKCTSRQSTKGRAKRPPRDPAVDRERARQYRAENGPRLDALKQARLVALRRLADLHPVEYEALLAAARVEAGLSPVKCDRVKRFV